MKSIIKLTRRFLIIFAASTLLLVIVNLALLAFIALGQSSNSGPWTSAKEIGKSLKKIDSGYILSEDTAQKLQQENIWAIYIDNSSLKVVWQSDNLPETIPLQYTASDIASFTRGYIEDYPVFTAGTEEGLVAAGFPKDSYWKHLYPSWDYDTIKNAPYIALWVLGINIAVIFVIYLITNAGLLRSVKPIASGIQSLPAMAPVFVREKGLLSDLAKDINRTAEILLTQQTDLRKKECARANWISGVSHDIRTPLSMVMGYAGQLEEDRSLSSENHKKAAVIRQQSVKIKNLINDLNLSSRLEYNMQPLRTTDVNLTAVIRQCAADLLNTDMDEKFPLKWSVPDLQSPCIIKGDKNLLYRAVSNLLNNARQHNPEGCRIFLDLKHSETSFCITVRDNGKGVSKDKSEKLYNTAGYLINDENSGDSRHGQGLLIVQQIVNAHHGKTFFSSPEPGGFQVDLILPK